MERIRRGFRLLGASWEVLRSDKELLVVHRHLGPERADPGPHLRCLLATREDVAGVGAAIGRSSVFLSEPAAVPQAGSGTGSPSTLRSRTKDHSGGCPVEASFLPWRLPLLSNPSSKASSPHSKLVPASPSRPGNHLRP